MSSKNKNGRKIGTFSRNVRSLPMELSIAEASSMFPGFRFSPTDEELIQYYLTKKIKGFDHDVELIPEVDICRHEPWDLPAQSIIPSENEWFFFTPRGRKYPNGSQSKRATDSGYWKATGKERRVKSGSNIIGTKRTLVFHTGRAPKGQRTEWIVHEYCTTEKSQDGMVVCRLGKNIEFHLNDNPRRNNGNLPSINNNSINALCDGEQDGTLEEAKVPNGYTKESSSSYNSHSVDTCSESDDKLADEYSQHDSSSLKKDYTEEDDCYADIMKDDIIKLDEATPSTPFQGTANLRLRLTRQRQKPCKAEPFEMSKFDKGNTLTENVLDEQTQAGRRCVIGRFLTSRTTFPSMFVFLVVFILLLLFLFFIGVV